MIRSYSTHIYYIIWSTHRWRGGVPILSQNRHNQRGLYSHSSWYIVTDTVLEDNFCGNLGINVFASLSENFVIGRWVGSCPTLSSKTVVTDILYQLLRTQNNLIYYHCRISGITCTVTTWLLLLFCGITRDNNIILWTIKYYDYVYCRYHLPCLYLSMLCAYYYNYY